MVQIDLQSGAGVTEQAGAGERLVEFVLLEGESGTAFRTLINVHLAVDHRVLDQWLEPAHQNVFVFCWTWSESRRRCFVLQTVIDHDRLEGERR